MVTRKPTTSKKKLSPTVQVAIVTAISTVMVALITGYFSLTQKQPTPSPSPTILPTNTLEVTSSPSASPTPSTIKVLFDTYHGNTTVIDKLSGYEGATIQNRGVVFERATTPFTLDYLKGYDVLVIYFWYYKVDAPKFSPAEIEAIREYNKQGGGVLLTGQGWVWTQYNDENPNLEDYPLNLIAEGSGISFSPYFIGEVDGVSYKQAPLVFQQLFMNHEQKILDGVNLVSSVGAPGTLIIEQSSNSSVTALIWGDENTFDSKNTPKPVVMASAEIEKGRLVAIGTIDFIVPFVDEKYETDYPDIYNHIELLGNVLSWLSGN